MPQLVFAEMESGAGQSPARPYGVTPVWPRFRPQPASQFYADNRLGIAEVGLGRLALEEIIPAFAGCKLAKLTALMTGDLAKRKQVAEQYGVPPEAVFAYDD